MLGLVLKLPRCQSRCHSRMPGVSGSSVLIDGCVKAANQTSMMAGISSAVAGSRMRGLLVDPMLDGGSDCLNIYRVC